MSRTDYRFRLSSKEIDNISELLADKLNELKTKKKDIIRIRLSIEEMLLDRLKDSEGHEGVFSFDKKWGRPCIEIRIRGAAQEDDIPEDEEFSGYGSRILENLGLKPTAFYEKGWNCIRLKLKKQERNPLFSLAAAAILAVVIGCGISLLFPQIAAVLYDIVTPLLDTFIGILTTIAGPMIFISVVWGILCIGDASTLGTIGKRMMFRFVLITFILTIIAFFIGCLFFNPAFDTVELDYSQFSSVYELILNIFPSNIIAPFYENNTMQILVIAIPCGIAMLILEQKTAVVADFTEQLNLIVQYLMEIITKIIPLYIFLSLLQLLLSGSLGQLADSWKLFLVVLTVSCLTLLFVIVFVSVKYKITIGRLVMKMLPTFLIALTTASSAAAFSSNIECCEKSLGINRKITRFSIPLGMVIYMPPLAMEIILLCVYMAGSYSVPISLNWIIIGILLSTVLAIAVPPIPGGSLTCYTIIFAQLGIPTEAIVIATILDIIFDFACTAINISMLQLELVLQSDAMGLLDRKVLRGENRIYQEELRKGK